MGTTVTLDRYAEMRAEMDTGRLRDEVLSRAGLSVDEWALAQREWLEKMGKELERDRFELTNRYTSVFVERLRVLTELAAAEKQTIPAPARTKVAREESGQAPGEDLAAQAPQVQSEAAYRALPQPSYVAQAASLMNAYVTPVLERPYSSLAEVSYSADYAVAYAQPSPSLEAAFPSQTSDPSETIALTGLVPEVKPFERAGSGSPAALDAAPFAPLPFPASHEDLGTMPLIRHSSGAVLPFPEVKSGEGTREEWTRPIRTAVAETPVHDPDDPGGTMFFNASLVPAAAPLPFQEPPAPFAAAGGNEAQSGLAPFVPAVQSGETLYAGLVSSDGSDTIYFAPAASALIAPVAAPAPLPAPPPPPSLPAVPALSLEQYAALYAELAVLPDTESVFLKYGLANPEVRRTVDATFRDLLASDPASLRRWHQLYAHYLSLLPSR